MTGFDTILLGIIVTLVTCVVIGLVSVYRWTANMPIWLAAPIMLAYVLAATAIIMAVTGTLPEVVR
jgi:hypothetical protein